MIAGTNCAGSKSVSAKFAARLRRGMIEQCIADLEGSVAIDSDYNLSHILVSIPEGCQRQKQVASDAKGQRRRDIYRATRGWCRLR